MIARCLVAAGRVGAAQQPTNVVDGLNNGESASPMMTSAIAVVHWLIAEVVATLDRLYTEFSHIDLTPVRTLLQNWHSICIILG